MQSVYLAGASSGTGKSAVALGFMEVLHAAGWRVGFFRPVVANGERDALTRVICARYELPFPPEMLYGCTAQAASELVAVGRYDDLVGSIFDKFKAVESSCDLVLVVGTDFDGLMPFMELDFNADLANNLGCSLVPVVKGFGLSAEDAANALLLVLESLRKRVGECLASFVNGVAQHRVDAVRGRLTVALGDGARVYVLPEQPSLGMPTVGEVREALGAECLCGDGDAMSRAIRGYKIGATAVDGFLDRIDEGSLVIVSGDRCDILLACLAADASRAFPQVAGLLLTEGLGPCPEVARLVQGMTHNKVPILSVALDSFAAARALDRLLSSILPDDHRKIAAALGIFESRVDAEGLRRCISASRPTRITPLVFEYALIRRARTSRQRIVLAEGGDERVLRAAEILVLREVAEPILLCNRERLAARADELGVKLDGVRIIDPATSPDRPRYARIYHELRKHKGISPQLALDTLMDVSYFGTLMVYTGAADGMVSGATHTTQHTLRPAFETIRTARGGDLISSVFFMCMPDRVLVYADCAINPKPSAEQLATIAISSAGTAIAFGVEPLIAMLSYSTGASGHGEDVERVREAVRIARERRPDLKIEGPIQYDVAVDPGVAAAKMPGSEVAGHATVFIFPDLDTGDSTCKAVQLSARAVAIGPVVQGLAKPVNDLSRGCTVADIVNAVAITAIQAQTARRAGGMRVSA